MNRAHSGFLCTPSTVEISDSQILFKYYFAVSSDTASHFLLRVAGHPPLEAA